jgi:glycogen debranching enzyme
VSDEGLQPDLHDTLICVRAPLMAVSARDGQIRGVGAHGYYLGDHRSLSRLILTINGREPTILSGEVMDATRALFLGHFRERAVPGDRDGSAEPQLLVERDRELTDTEIREHVRLTNADRKPRRLRVQIEIACSYAEIDEVKAGGRGEAGTVHEVRHDVLGWRSYSVPIAQHSRSTPGTTVSATPRADKVSATSRRSRARVRSDADLLPTIGRFVWRVVLEPGASWTAVLTVNQPKPPRPFPFKRPEQAPPWSYQTLRAPTQPLDRLLHNSLADLDALRLTTAPADGAGPVRPDLPREEFVAAGAPWYLTLFGRDSLWTARMLLPIDRELALGTLSMLSRYQGDKDGLDNDERPGKIPHELRAGPTSHGGTLSLPPVYYGSVDATLLFIILMAETWQRDQDRNGKAIKALLPALHGALKWLERQVEDHPAGFIAYSPKPGQLAHQGWKDSPDAVTFASGRPADGPIALCEVQAYAYEAAIGAAALLEGLEGAHAQAARWRAWAVDFKRRFHDRFWVEDRFGRYPAIALDCNLVPVDGPSSNIGHLLSGDFLNDEDAEEIARLLVDSELNSGWGIRTRSAGLKIYNPYSYHSGSVWPHDTAIAILGLYKRVPDAAAILAQNLCDASTAFGYRLPELFSGIERQLSPQPVPVSAACLPQAWASASAVVIAQAVGGLDSEILR